MRVFALVEVGDPGAIDVRLREVDASRAAGLPAVGDRATPRLCQRSRSRLCFRRRERGQRGGCAFPEPGCA